MDLLGVDLVELDLLGVDLLGVDLLGVERLALLLEELELREGVEEREELDLAGVELLDAPEDLEEPADDLELPLERWA